jgi:hypothetical protein
MKLFFFLHKTAFWLLPMFCRVSDMDAKVGLQRLISNGMVFSRQKGKKTFSWRVT